MLLLEHINIICNIKYSLSNMSTLESHIQYIF